MSKYEPLSRFLEHLQGDYWRPTFHEIERVLGFELPGGARKRAAWWTAEPESRRGHARAWLDAGWRAEHVDLAKGRITFRRAPTSESTSQARPRPSLRSIASRPPAMALGAIAMAGVGVAMLVARRARV